MLKWVGATVVVMAFVVSRFALADTESDRNSLIQTIQDKVNRIASKLNGFANQRDNGYADDAQSYAGEVADLVGKLRDVRESDSRANQITDNYPGYISSFRDGLRYLKELKKVQFLADGVADRCVHDEADLQQAIRIYVGHPEDADDANDKLTARGQELGRAFGPLLERLKNANYDFNNNVSSARFDISVSSSDPWNDVRSNFKDSVSAIQSYWKDKFSPVESACKRLALGEKHPDIVSALADLGKYKGDTKQTVTQLKKDYNAWLAGARKVREMTIQDHAEVREVMCRQGVDEEDIAKKANAVADRWASQISSTYGTLLGQSDRLTDRALADKLKKYKGAREVAEGLRANRATLDKIKNSDLQGSNNPKIKVRMKYGTDYHASWSCSGYKEFKIDSSYCSNPIRSGSGCAADCVVPGSSCEVIELKPKNDEAISMGTKQKDAYEAGLRTWFTKNKDELLSKYPNISACIKDGQISTKSRIETYNVCPDAPKDLGEELDLSSDVSESD
jgi:uncharacterized phage infection (PIP) family protein YhgE